MGTGVSLTLLLALGTLSSYWVDLSLSRQEGFCLVLLDIVLLCSVTVSGSQAEREWV